MFPVTCRNLVCKHSFSSDSLDGVNCPVCGETAASRADSDAVTVERSADQYPSDVLDSTWTTDAPTTRGTAEVSAVSMIGRFRVRSKLGAGAFGEVYRALDPQLDREVALKVAKPGTLDSPERIGRFLREARAAANLRHPNIVPVHDSGKDGDRHYIATGFVDGRTLEAEIEDAEGKPLDLRRAADVMRKLAEALGYAHRQGVVHRDVKPANVLVDRSGAPSLTDFGLAVRAGDDAVKTQDGRVMGTAAYMSPEQAAGRSAEATAAADQYALGVMLFEMATGRRPFRGAMEVVLSHQIQTAPPRPRAVNPLIPKDLETVILKCLEKEPAKRYANCEAMADDLRRFLDGEPVTARRIGPLERTARWAKRNPVVAGSLTAAVLALAVGLGVALWQAGEARYQERQAEAKAEALGVSEADAKAKALALGVSEADAKAKAEALRVSEADAKKQAADLAVQLKESRRVHDLSRLREAEAAWDKNLPQLAREKLTEIAPENRCIVWGLLNRRFEGSELTLWGHQSFVVSVGFSPDGTRIVSGSSDGTARVWDATTGQCLHELKGHAAWVMSVGFSSDGARIVSGASDGTARVWDATTGQCVRELKGHTGRVARVAFSPNGKQIAAGGATTPETRGMEAVVRVWDADTGQNVREMKGLRGTIQDIAFSPDGSRIAAGSFFQSGNQGLQAEGVMRVWDAGTGECVLDLRSNDISLSLAYSPDGKRIATGLAGGVVRVWDAVSGQIVRSMKMDPGNVDSVTFSPDGKQIATGSRNGGMGGVVRVWDVATGQCLHELKGHTASVVSVGFSPDGTRIVSGSQDGSVRVWNAAGQRVRELKGHATLSQIQMVRFSPDGTRIVTGAGDEMARVLDATTGQCLFEMKGHMRGGNVSVDFSPDGSRIVTGSLIGTIGGPIDGVVRVWDAVTGQCVLEWKEPNHFITSAAFSPDGKRIATGSNTKSVAGLPPDGVTRVWDATTGQCILELKGPASSVAFSPDGTRIAVGSTTGQSGAINGEVRVWDAVTGQRLQVLKGDGWVGRVAFSPDGTRIAATSVNSAQVWDAVTGERLQEMKGHAGALSNVVFSPNGTRIVTGSQDGTIRVWDTVTGQPLLELSVQASVPNARLRQVSHVTLSPDGTRIAAVAMDATIQVWDAAMSQRAWEMKVHTRLVTSAKLSSDGTRIVTGSDDGSARVWDVITGRLAQELKGHTDRVMSVRFSPDDTRIVTGSSDGSGRVWNAATGQFLRELKGHTGKVRRTRFSPDGKHVATGSADTTARVWDVATGQCLHELKGHTGSVESVVFSPDGTRIVTGSSDGTARVWAVMTGQCVWELKGHMGWVVNVVFSPDGKRIFTRSENETVKVWDAVTGQEVQGATEPMPVMPEDRWTLPDGRLVIPHEVRLVIVDPRVSADELVRRRLLARPDPQRHIELISQYAHDPFAREMQISLEQRARGILAAEALDFNKAQAHWINSMLLKPKPYRWPEIAPPPRPER